MHMYKCRRMAGFPRAHMPEVSYWKGDGSSSFGDGGTAYAHLLEVPRPSLTRVTRGGGRRREIITFSGLETQDPNAKPVSKEEVDAQYSKFFDENGQWIGEH